MKALLERETVAQKLMRKASLAVSVIIVLIMVLSLTAMLLPIHAESESGSETAASTATETKAESGTETSTETGKDWSTTTVEVESKDNFLTIILKGIGTFLRWITRYLTGRNYIVALFVFALLVEIIMIPFGIKQQKNSIKQAKLRPKEMAIRKKYAGHNDQATRQKMQQEIQALYQENNFNPMSGCLPLLLQLPIILVLYYIVIDPFKYVIGLSDGMKEVITAFLESNGRTISSSRGTIELLTQVKEVGLPFFEGLKTFTQNGQACYDALAGVYDQIPSFNVFGLNCGYMITDPAASKWLYVIPVLTFGAQFGSMKLNRKLTYQVPATGDEKTQGCSNNVMDLVMPLFSVYITFIVPAAVAIYWIFKSITGVLKQLLMSKIMPYPVFTEEDYKAAEREILGKNPKRKKGGNSSSSDYVVPSGKKSLHHIDDDEYEDTAKAPARRTEPYREDDEEQIETAEKSRIDVAPLKDEERPQKREKAGKRQAEEADASEADNTEAGEEPESLPMDEDITEQEEETDTESSNPETNEAEESSDEGSDSKPKDDSQE